MARNVCKSMIYHREWSNTMFIHHQQPLAFALLWILHVPRGKNGRRRTVSDAWLFGQTWAELTQQTSSSTLMCEALLCIASKQSAVSQLTDVTQATLFGSLGSEVQKSTCNCRHRCRQQKRNVNLQNCHFKVLGVAPSPVTDFMDYCLHALC